MLVYAAAAAKSLQSCPTLSDPMDCSPPGSSIHGIFQERVLEWGAIAFSVRHCYSSCLRKRGWTRWPGHFFLSVGYPGSLAASTPPLGMQ